MEGDHQVTPHVEIALQINIAEEARVMCYPSPDHGTIWLTSQVLHEGRWRDVHDVPLSLDAAQDLSVFLAVNVLRHTCPEALDLDQEIEDLLKFAASQKVTPEESLGDLFQDRP
jgi:hypothetical protein